MTWQFPFVSRARYSDREREIAELKGELAKLRDRYDRVIDEINFRSTGFHLDERFSAKEQSTPVAAAPEPSEAEQPTGLEDAIRRVGTRPSAVRRYLETTSMTGLAEQERIADEARKQAHIDKARRLLEQALESGSEKAKAAQQSAPA
jgi:hypothetical protein